MDCTHHIFNNFPRSQHRPDLLHIEARHGLTEAIPKPRWNFMAHVRESFARDIDRVQYIPAWSLKRKLGTDLNTAISPNESNIY
jgi:hypothetical protein